MDTVNILHKQVWERFVRMPQGHIFDYADKKGNTYIPTAEECKRSMPNALGWWTSIENCAFFTGLYAYALIHRYEKTPQAETAAQINILINGLCQLQDVTGTDGFIARGVADDNVSHYPISSEDQIVPWILAMNAYLHCPLCTEKEQIKARLLRTLRGLQKLDWQTPTEIDGMRTKGWTCFGNWRSVAKLLYCARLLYELTEDVEDLKKYEALRDGVPEGWYYSRKEIISHGFSHDMVRVPALKQSWIFVAAHLGIRELCKLDIQNSQYYFAGLKMNGVTSLCLIDDMKRYDNKTDGFDMDWRRLEPYWKPIGKSIEENTSHALGEMLKFWESEVVPHRHMEHTVLGFSIFSAWIAVTCGDENIKQTASQKFIQNCGLIDWENLNLSYAFAAEATLIFASYHK